MTRSRICAHYARDVARATTVRSDLPYSSYKSLLISILLRFRPLFGGRLPYFLLLVLLFRRALGRAKAGNFTHVGGLAIITLFWS